MAKVKINLDAKNDSELLTFSQQHIAAMDGNANFTTPLPDAAAFQALHDDFEAALDAAALAQQSAMEKTASKDAARAALEAGFKDRANYVEIASGGDEAKILSSHFDVRGPATPVGPLPAPVDFLASMGAMEGTIELGWTPVYGAFCYVIQCSPYATPRSWSQVAIATKASATVPGCTPGEKSVFRVAAVGAAGQGPWSDESVKMAP